MEEIVKIVMVGNSAVGKTSLLNRWINKHFSVYNHSTIGANFVSYRIKNSKYRLNIWDTAGQERFRAMVALYYRDVYACIIVFDISSYDSASIEYWIKDYLEKTTRRPNIILLGNKYDIDPGSDMTSSPPPAPADILPLIDKYHLKFFHTSALTGYNVDKIFQYICDMRISDENGGLVMEDDTVIAVRKLASAGLSNNIKNKCC